MARILTIVNQKGGVGKSTTAQALGAGLTLKGYRTLVVDLDAQGNTSFSLGAKNKAPNALNVLMKESTAKEAIQPTSYADLIVSSKALSNADLLLTETGKEYRLKEALKNVADLYDYIIVDTPPTLGVLSTNALTAADAVIIPALADLYSLQGIADLAETIRLVKRYCNPNLRIEGILLNRYDARSNFTEEVSDLANDIAKRLDSKVFSASIRETVTVRKAQASQMSIYEYAPKAKVTADYLCLLNEIIEGEKSNGES